MMPKALLVGLSAWLTLTGPTRQALTAESGVSVWYRGVPAGVPRQDDLARIRALGFSAVTWPLASAAAVPALRQMADVVGLTVVLREMPVPLSAASALNPGAFGDVDAARTPAAEIAPIVWRAIAHGSRAIAFDAGSAEGDGWRDHTGGTPAWVGPALAIARQVMFNARLFGALQRGPAVVMAPRAPEALDIVLLDGGRPWVLVATNTSRDRARGVARLPAVVPYALWVNLLDGSQLSMLNQPSGPSWSVDLEAWGARVYVIDKAPK